LVASAIPLEENIMKTIADRSPGASQDTNSNLDNPSHTQPPDPNKLRDLLDTDHQSVDSKGPESPIAMLLYQAIMLFLSALASGGSVMRLIGIYAAISVSFFLVRLASSVCRMKSESHEQQPYLIDRFTSRFIVVNGIVVPALLALAYVIFQMPLVFAANPLGAINELAIVLAVPIALGASWYSIVKRRWAYATISGSTAGLALGVSAALTMTWIFQPPLSEHWGPSNALGCFILWAPIAFLASSFMLTVLLNVQNAQFRLLGSLAALVGIAASGALTFVPHIQDYAADLKMNTAVTSAGEEQEQAINYFKNNFSAQQLSLLFADPAHDGRYAFGKLRLFERPTIQAVPYFLMTGKSVSGLYSTASTTYVDPALGQQIVGECVPGLALTASNLEGTLNPDALSGSLDWTMVFRNAGKNPAETRSEIQLPPGAVVSRVTAWINGKPVEASFDTTYKTTNAYQWVVQKHRDPILVTASGQDRVFVQAYPVPPYGGYFKLRLGIKTPLALSASGHCDLDLPRFSSKNFVSKASQAINLSGKEPFIQQPGSTLTLLANDKHHLGGKLPPSRNGELLPRVTLERPYDLKLLATPDATSHGQKFIVQKIVPQHDDPVQKLVLVIDTSSSLKEHSAAIKKALSSLASNQRASAIFASQVTGTSSAQVKEVAIKSDTEELLPEYSIGEALKQIDAVPFSGGTNNDGAVLQGLESAASVPGGTVIWLHGPQPLPPALTQLESLGIFNKPRLVDLQIGSDRNELINEWRQNQLNSLVAYDHVAVENLASDLESMITRYALGKQSYIVTQQLVDKKPGIPISNSPQLAAELSSLWASKAISGLLERGDTSSAERIGTDYHVVSPVTGAVALEKQSDYSRNYLKESRFRASQRATGPNIGQIAAGSLRRTAAARMATHAIEVSHAQAPTLTGAVNGTIGPQGIDATVIAGVNTAGATRVNAQANLEAIVAIAISLLQWSGYIYVAVALSLAFKARKVDRDKSQRLIICALAALTLAVMIAPGANELIAWARDANLFS
jgi:hypothetical protein